MSSLLPILLNSPVEKHTQAEYNQAVAQYLKELAEIPRVEWARSLEKTDLLDQLDASANSIAYLYTLHKSLALVNGSVPQAQHLLPYFTTFFTTCDPTQVAYVSEKYREVYHWTASALAAAGITDVAFMGQALQRTADLSQFSTCHLTYLKLCLQSQRPSLACLILDQDIYSFATSRKQAEDDASVTASSSDEYNLTRLASVDNVLEYYLLGAGVYIGLSRWPRARLFLEFVILHPSINNAASAYQVEAYKRWVMIGLLMCGSSLLYLRTVNQAVMRNIKAVSKPYDVLADTFKSRDWRKLQAEVDTGTRIWQEDGNARLVQAVAEAILPQCISDMRRVYNSVTLSTIAQRLRVDEQQAATLVEHLIQRGQLLASLTSLDNNPSSSPSALRFAKEGADIPASYAQHAAEQSARIDKLVQAIADADRRLQLTKEHLDLARRGKRQQAENDPADQMDLEWSPPGMPTRGLIDDGDEDIMA